jgi:hypothetical protein
MSTCNSYVRTQHFVRRYTSVPFRRFLGELLHNLSSAALLGTLGSYLRDALQEGSAGAVACLLVPRALACGVFSLFSLFDWWFPLLFLIKN